MLPVVLTVAELPAGNVFTVPMMMLSPPGGAGAGGAELIVYAALPTALSEYPGQPMTLAYSVLGLVMAEDVVLFVSPVVGGL